MENFVDFNTLYGLAGDEMERIDNESLQRELEKVQQAQQGVNDSVGFNAIDSIGNIDYQNTSLADIEGQGAGGWNTAQSTMQYGDFMKAQQGLEKLATDISKKTGGMYGSLRQGYGDDTLAAKLMAGDEEGMNTIFANDENFNDEIARNQGKQNAVTEEMKSRRRGYVDSYNENLQKQANANALRVYNKYQENLRKSQGYESYNPSLEQQRSQREFQNEAMADLDELYSLYNMDAPTNYGSEASDAAQKLSKTNAYYNPNKRKSY